MLLAKAWFAFLSLCALGGLAYGLVAAPIFMLSVLMGAGAGLAVVAVVLVTFLALDKLREG